MTVKKVGMTIAKKIGLDVALKAAAQQARKPIKNKLVEHNICKMIV
jgi:hypothetical protein